MIDALAKRFSVHSAKPSELDYNPDHAVVNQQLYENSGDQLTVLFPPWHGGKRAYDILTRRLLTRGDDVLRYVFHDDILHPDVNKVSRSFDVIKQSVAESLHGIADQERYQRIKLTAVSLGAVNMAMVTSEFDRFDSATMVTPASSLAHCTWNGMMTTHLRQAYEDSGITSGEELEEKWSPISPANHVAALRGKRLKIVASLHDRAIPSEYQQLYLHVLQSESIEATVEFSRFGHYGTIAQFCIAGSLD